MINEVALATWLAHGARRLVRASGHGGASGGAKRKKGDDVKKMTWVWGQGHIGAGRR